MTTQARKLITPRDVDLVRVFTDLIAVGIPELFPPGQAARLPRLHRRGLLERTRMVVALPEFLQPLRVVHPNEAEPELGSLAWLVKKRWLHAEPRRTHVYFASALARLIFAGTKRLRRPLQTEHELGVLATFFRIIKTRPSIRPQNWIGEDRIHSVDSRLPLFDAIIVHRPDMTPVRAIEIAGQYSKSRLHHVVRNARQHKLTLEIW